MGPENHPDVPAVRASDADRDRVAAALQAAFAEGRLSMPELDERLAAAYAAGTGTELATIMQDLRASAPQPGDLAGAAPTSVRDVGIIAGFERTGRWMVGRTFRGLAVIGNGEIDLRQARFIDGETTIHATAIIGDITVVVPEDADVHIGGTGIIGGFDHHDEGPGTPGAPRITITGLVVCGSVRVERRSAGAKAAGPALQTRSAPARAQAAATGTQAVALALRGRHGPRRPRRAPHPGGGGGGQVTAAMRAAAPSRISSTDTCISPLGSSRSALVMTSRNRGYCPLSMTAGAAGNG